MERGVVSARGAHEHIRAFRAHALDRRDIANLRLDFEGQTFSIGASIGLTYGRAGMHTATSALKAADAACYAAKEGGRNRVRMLPADDAFKTTGRFSLDRLAANSA